MLVTTLGALALMSVPALATPPEAPEAEKVEAVTTTTAHVSGVLNPKASGSVEGGFFGFLYGLSAPGACGEERLVPEPFTENPEGFALGFSKEEVKDVLTGLQPHARYTFCLLERNNAGEQTLGAPVPFETQPAPPTVESESVPTFKAVEARLEGVVNPNNQSTVCSFQYGTEPLLEKGTTTTLCEPGALAGFGGQGVGLTAAGLEENTTYYYRIVATNPTGTTNGAIEHFTTALTPETPETLEAVEVTSTSAKLTGALRPPGTKLGYVFAFNEGATCTGGSRTPSSPAEGEGAVSAVAEGLLPGTTYTFCLQASNGVGETAFGAPQTFTTPAVAATVGEESFSNVGSSTATLNAKINPGGAPTNFYFEYGTTSAYGSKTPTESAGAASTPVSVLASIEGLTPDTAYHFRVIATNTEGPAADGADTSFSTFPASLPALPDGRGYEVVSPLDTASGVTVLLGSPTRAAPDGSKVIYYGTAESEGGIGNELHIQESNKGSNAYLAVRSPAGGWSTTNLQPTGIKAGFQAFSSDLSRGFLSSEEPLFEGAPAGPALYVRNNADGAIRLVAARASYAGTNPDQTHTLIATAGTLYDDTEGQLKPVSVLLDGTPATAASFGSPELNSGEDNLFPQEDLENAVSADGSRIFWSTAGTEEVSFPPYVRVRPKALYVRENDTGPNPETLQLDAAEPGCLSEGKCVSGGGVYRGATPDGSRVFFTDEHRLTANSNATSGKSDLYRYEFSSEPGKPGVLTDLTPDATQPANVAGVLGISEDGSYVYFAAGGALAPGAEPQECVGTNEVETDTTKCNVYELHDQAQPVFVGAVKAADGLRHERFSGGTEDVGDWTLTMGSRGARVSADGRHLLFTSRESLTSFDSEGNSEAYIYDLGSGISCVSCNPSGRPDELESAQNEGSRHLGSQIVLPRSGVQTYGLRYVSASFDRVFFESDEPLVPSLADANMSTPRYTNGLFNVYEWERDGSGTCTTPNGCIYVLSGGTSSDSSFFIDASTEGEDVFLGSRAQLVPQDHGETFEAYDARIGASAPLATPACSGAGCQGVPPAPPSFATPASSTFTGGEDFQPASSSDKPKTAAQIRAEKLAKALNACRKDRSKRKRTNCQKTARRRYGAAKASRAIRASNDRRAN